MRISSSKESAKKIMVDTLVELGYEKANAEKIYKRYKAVNKLENLQEYIDTKLSTMRKDDYSYPLRDM